ncbi:hypothetical protein CIHG_00313 [Coccidioides immitis H538.4]|uniref:Uncharacterized protein n=2 Tax=Coccidioides immitis TaxID=5501 RepID=A0A0J8QI26_COCIT|nr:hypothetical protein CISG_00400 [Coccidioides immitis RMSCC 3703]KMU82532.1 hypothetical protein CIHG_00313 [Coccidioides immitis H538.4]
MGVLENKEWIEARIHWTFGRRLWQQTPTEEPPNDHSGAGYRFWARDWSRGNPYQVPVPQNHSHAKPLGLKPSMLRERKFLLRKMYLPLPKSYLAIPIPTEAVCRSKVGPKSAVPHTRPGAHMQERFNAWKLGFSDFDTYGRAYDVPRQSLVVACSVVWMPA